VSDLSFDPDAALKVRRSLAHVVIAANDVEQRLGRTALPAMPGGTHAQVAALLADAISSMRAARLGTMAISKALRDQAASLGVYDKFAAVHLGGWTQALGVGVWVGKNVFSADVLYNWAGGLEPKAGGDWYDPTDWRHVGTDASVTNADKWASTVGMALNFVDLPVRPLLGRLFRGSAEVTGRLGTEDAIRAAGHFAGPTGHGAESAAAAGARPITEPGTLIVDANGRPLKYVPATKSPAHLEVSGPTIVDANGRPLSTVPRTAPPGRLVGGPARPLLGPSGAAIRVLPGRWTVFSHHLLGGAVDWVLNTLVGVPIVQGVHHGVDAISGNGTRNQARPSSGSSK
jgi:hypothetical protein